LLYGLLPYTQFPRTDCKQGAGWFFYMDGSQWAWVTFDYKVILEIHENVF